ncbi:hypothetical protein KKG16_02265, partial [Patescibacteria group bacterium]|nr:hypothetical protein [Patescibacteria group bacterium]
TEFIKDGKIIKLTPGQAPDLSDITIDFNIDSIPPALREQIDNEILMEVAQIKEFQNLSESELRSHLDRVLEYLYDKEHSVPLRNRKVNYDELGEIEKAIVEVMVRKVANDDTVSSLRSSLFIDADTSDNWQQKAIKAFEDLLDPEKGSLKNKDIASMYYLLRLSQESASKPGPNLMLAMKSLSLLRQNPDNRKVVINLESQLFNRVVSLFIDTATDAEGLTEAMEKMKIPPEHQTTVSNVGETIRLKTADAVQEAIDRSMAEARNFPIFWIAGIIAGTAAVGVPVGVQIRRVTYQLNAGRLHRFYTDAISSTEDLTKFRRVFNLDNSITIEQIRSARIAAKDIYSEITDLQSRFAILERGRLNKRGKSLLSSMKKSEFERYGKQIRKQFPKSPEKVARILSSFEADPAKLQEILLKSGYSAEQVQQGIGPLLVEALKSDRATELMKQFDDLYTELDEIEKIPEAAKRRAARDAFRQKVEKYMGELDGFKKVGDTGMLRRQISQKLLSRLTGNTIEISDDLWEVIEKAHKMDSIPEKVSALKKALSQVDGLDEAQRTSAMRRFVRLGITGEAPSAVLRMPVKTIEQARLMFDLLDPDQVVRFLRELPRKLPSFRPEAFTELIGRAKEAFTSTPSVAADITRLERASGLATDSLKLGKVYKGGKLVGRSLLVFGILLEGYFMNITYQEIKQADKQGNENEKRILRSKLYTQGADAGVGVVGVPVAFAFSGPAGWLALGGLVTKNYTSDYLYDYAIDANRVELQQFRQKQPSELVAIMEGERDWLVENQASKEYRRDTALHAYIYNNRIVDFTSEDEAYLQHTCNDSEEFDKQRMIIFEDKIGHFYNDMLSFLQENKEQLSKYPFSEQLELAQSFAELRHLRRRAKQLENPEILESELQNLRGANPYLGTDLSLGPPARASNEVISYLEAHQQNKLQALYYPYLMQMTLEKRDKQSKRDRVNFVVKLSETLLQHDEAEYLSDVAGESDNWPEHRRIDTFVKIMDYEVNQMFKRPMSFDQFVTKIQKLKNELREFMQDGKTLDPNEQRSSYFGEYKLDWRKKGKNRD